MAKERTRPCIIAGNWKMYKTIDQALSFISEVAPIAENSPCQVLLAVPYTAIKPVSDKAKDSKITIGAQNMNDASEGAFTGEVAGIMLKEAGAEFVILGHSERRQWFHESNDFVNKKVQRALGCGLRPLLCVGETYEEHQDKQSQAVVKSQIEECLAGIDKSASESLIIAYEPRWAIGSGLAATSDVVQEMHQYIQQILAAMWTEKEARKVPILYGGSVSESNARQFLSTEGIDGLLIGSASLRAETFAKIIAMSQNV